MSLAAKILAGTTGSLAVCACIYHALGIWSAAKVRRSRRQSTNSPYSPPVSILKPMRGVDPGMYESLRSHCVQRYPEYEILFGVSQQEDPAISLVRQLQQEFPELAIRLVSFEQILGTNVKVSTLAQMLPQARYDYLLVNDSDIRVERDYLESVMSAMADPAVGLVTCLYRGVPASTLGSRLESLGISDFACGVLVASQLEGISFGLGSTLAFSRASLQSIGGFESILDYLADDFELGNRIYRSGKTVRLSDAVVEDFLPAYTFREFVDHQLRWARTVRDSRRWGYAGLIFTFGLPWAAITVLLSRGAAWAWVLLAATAAIRCVSAVVVNSAALQHRKPLRDLYLLPLRDFFALGLWIASFAGHRIAWRGEEYILDNGKLRPSESQD